MDHWVGFQTASGTASRVHQAGPVSVPGQALHSGKLLALESRGLSRQRPRQEGVNRDSALAERMGRTGARRACGLWQFLRASCLDIGRYPSAQHTCARSILGCCDSSYLCKPPLHWQE